MKAQWFIITAVVVISFLVFISYIFSLFNRVDIHEIDEDYYFMNFIIFKNQSFELTGNKNYAVYYITSKLKGRGMYINDTIFMTDKIVINYDNI